MAMTEDEARRLAEAFNELNNVTASRSKEEIEAARAAREFDMKVSAATTVVSNLAKTYTAYNRALYDGEKGAKAFAASTDAMANSIEALGAALALLLPIGRVAKIAIAGLSLLAGEVTRSSKIFGEQADNVRNAFDQLAQAGLTGAEGMEGVFDQIQRFGLNIKDAGHVAKLMGENATGMALFGKTTRDGYLEFNKTIEGLEQFRTEFRNLGLDQKAQIDAAMGLRKQQQLLVMGTKAQMDASSTAVKRYVEETDRLTRITGLSRQQQEKAVEDALSNQAYGATIANLQDENTDASRRSIDQFNKIQKILSSLGPEMEKAGQDAAGGFVGASDRAGKLFQASNGKYQALVEDIQNKRITSDEELASRLQDVFQTMGRTEKMFRGQQQMLNADTFLLPAQEMRKGAQLGSKDLAGAFQEAAKTQKEAIQGDATLNKSTELLVRQQQEELKLQKDVQRGVLNYLTTINTVGGAMNGLTDAARKAADALGLINGSKPGPGGMPATGAVPAKGAAPGAAPKSEATAQAQTEVSKIQEKVNAAKTELETNKKAQTQAKADLQTALMENKSNAEIAAAKQKIVDLAKQETKIKETIVEQEKTQQTAQQKVLAQQRIDQQLLYKARDAEQMVIEVQKEITSNKQGLATLRDARFEAEKELADREAKVYKTSSDLQQINVAKSTLKNLNEKIVKEEKQLGEKEKQLVEFQKTLQSAKKALPTAATETVNIDIDREKFAKVDRENFEKYEARKKELYDKELKEIEADTNLDARQRTRLREKAAKMAEETSAKEFAGKIKAAGAGQVTVTQAPTASTTAGATAGAPSTGGVAGAPATLQNGQAETPEAAARSMKAGGLDTKAAMAPGSLPDKPLKSVVTAGPGFVVAETTDGEMHKRIGDHNWRDNNPGNLRFTNFSKKAGAIGNDGGYSVFPDMSTGRQAKQDLLQLPVYQSLSIRDAISRYAPPSENNTEAYIKAIVEATGSTETTLLKDLQGSQMQSMYAAIARQEGNLRQGKIVQAADGGVFKGPESGFPATLHGHEAVIPLKGGAVPVNIGGFDKFASAMTQYLNAQARQSEKLYARPTDMAAGLVKSSVGTEDVSIQNKIIDTTVSKVVGSIPGVKELGSILSIAETLQSDNISTAEKVLEIAKLLNPTIRMVSKLYDAYDRVQTVTTALNAPDGLIKQLSGDLPGGDRVSMAKDFDQDIMNKLSEQKATPLTPTVATPTDTANFKELADVMKQTASMNEAMVSMMSELVKQQQTSNDISNKMLRVAQN